MTETVTITLDRYNEYLFYKEKYELLQDIYNSLIEVLEDENFNLENPLHKKIYEIYVKLC